MARRTSLATVVVGVLIAVLAQLVTLALVSSTATGWVTRASAPTAYPAPSGPIAGATASPTPTVAQTTGPVEVTDAVQRGVVLISGRTGNQGVAGTGMVLTADGYVLTNYHVVRSTSSVTATVALTGRHYTATLVGRDATKDVALLKLEGASRLDVVTLDQDPVAIGDAVVAAGNANGQGFVSANRGNVQALNTSIQVRSASENDPPQRLRGLIQANAAAWPGDSGGPMFDAQGEVLGMTTAGGTTDESDEDRRVYGVPIAAAMQVVTQVRAGDESGTVVIGPKAYLGVVVESDDTAQEVVITRVEASTPASRAGLRTGDIITSLDGHPIGSRADLSTALDGIEPGSIVDVGWTTSSGRERTGTVTVTASSIN